MQTKKKMEYLGIDIGGSGIKGAIVDTETGRLKAERLRIATPQPATPEAIAQTVAQLIGQHNYAGKVGCGFPAVVQNGVVRTASNIDKAWIGINAEEMFKRHAPQCNFVVLNDADVAGRAEAQFGNGAGFSGTIMMLTIGTGIGSALIRNGLLVPNTELGHLWMQNGFIAEKYCSDAVRKNQDMKWKQWATRFNEYLELIEKLFLPDLIVIGGGTSKKLHKFQEYITIQTPIKPALLLNNAGIIGAALEAANLPEKATLQ